jgi:hypothetical protein
VGARSTFHVEIRGPKAAFPAKSVCGRYLGYDFPNFNSHRMLLPPTSGRGQWKPWQSRHVLFDESKPAASQTISLDVANRASLPAAMDPILMPAIMPPAPPSNVPVTTPPLGGVSPAGIQGTVPLSPPTTVPAPAATPVHHRAHHNPLYSDGSLPTIHEHEETEEDEETALEPHVSVTPPALPAL